jgi:CRP/FNR family transcriptional regulator
MFTSVSQAFGLSEFQRSAFLAFASSTGTVAVFERGEAIFRESDPALYMYVVLSGSVSLTSHDRVIERIDQGSSLGILSLLDQQPRTVTAIACERTEVALFDRKRFRYMVEEVPNFSMYVMAELAHRLRATNAML